jgi:hypothetical protein
MRRIAVDIKQGAIGVSPPTSCDQKVQIHFETKPVDSMHSATIQFSVRTHESFCRLLFTAFAKCFPNKETLGGLCTIDQNNDYTPSPDCYAHAVLAQLRAAVNPNINTTIA